ncbi:unnamed protein product [Prorocentrum cordatum]|uniref:U1-type domain-containing protein n=1 Tax=Prorocentrum cordatum TaxID=2364126 RepID=A0ABN9VCR6_9DINO|nr:unnamed protein product [Polarella glacialis]
MPPPEARETWRRAPRSGRWSVAAPAPGRRPPAVPPPPAPFATDPAVQWRRQAGQIRGARLYTVCSCGHWTWDDLLAKRHNLCVGCQSLCHPISSSVGGGGQMLLYTGAEESGWGEGGSNSKGRWRKGTQALQVQQGPSEAIPPQTLAAVKEAASHLAPDLAQKLLAQFVPKPPPQPQATPQAEWQRASQAKKASKEKLDKALARRAALDKEASDLDKHLDELMARDLENADILEQATRKLAVGVLKPAEPSPSKNVISLDDLFKDSAEKIKFDFGEELDVSGPAFSAEDREEFEKFKLEQSQQVKTLLHGALTSIKSQYKTHQEADADAQKPSAGASDAGAPAESAFAELVLPPTFSRRAAGYQRAREAAAALQSVPWHGAGGPPGRRAAWLACEAAWAEAVRLQEARDPFGHVEAIKTKEAWRDWMDEPARVLEQLQNAEYKITKAWDFQCIVCRVVMTSGAKSHLCGQKHWKELAKQASHAEPWSVCGLETQWVQAFKVSAVAVTSCSITSRARSPGMTAGSLGAWPTQQQRPRARQQRNRKRPGSRRSSSKPRSSNQLMSRPPQATTSSAAGSTGAPTASWILAGPGRTRVAATSSAGTARFATPGRWSGRPAPGCWSSASWIVWRGAASRRRSQAQSTGSSLKHGKASFFTGRSSWW